MRGESALQELVEDYLNTKLVLWVYNSEFDVVREVELVPRRGWGGEGVLGAELGFGVLHRLPAGLSDQVQEPGEALFESRVSGEHDTAAAAPVGGNFIVPADAPLTCATTPSRVMSPNTPQSAGATTFTQQFASPPPPHTLPTPPIPGAIPPPPRQGSAGPSGQAAFVPRATPATHSRAGRRQRHAHNTAPGLDEYFKESEKQSQEQDYALTKNTAAVPPPPKAKGGPGSLPSGTPPPPPAAAAAAIAPPPATIPPPPPASGSEQVASPAEPPATDAAAEGAGQSDVIDTNEQPAHAE